MGQSGGLSGDIEYGCDSFYCTFIINPKTFRFNFASPPFLILADGVCLPQAEMKAQDEAHASKLRTIAQEWATAKQEWTERLEEQTQQKHLAKL